ncbi:MAG: DivIVA domain protein [Solirubrobacterales bacterium]|nr:DivIVA domain protein [Solirubrobacterales bacterium]
MAADEHALIQEVAEPLERIPYHPLEDVASPEFAIALRGYDRHEVDAYVARVAQLVAELEATRVPEAAVRRALERVGEETSGILKRAHETAHELVTRSRAEAEDRLERARVEAEAIVVEARKGLKSIDDDTDRVWVERTRLLEDTRKLADAMLAVAESGIERFPPEEPPAPETVVELDLADEAIAPPPTEAIEPPTAPAERADRDT